MRKWGPCPGSGAQPWAGMVTCRLRPHGPCWAQNVCTEEHEPPVTEPPQNPTGHSPLGAKGLGSQAAGGRATRAPGWHRMSGARHSGPMGGPSRGGPTVHMAPGRPPLGLEAPAEQTPISGGPQATGNSHGHPCYPLPAAPRSQVPDSRGGPSGHPTPVSSPHGTCARPSDPEGSARRDVPPPSRGHQERPAGAGPGRSVLCGFHSF